MKKTSRGFKIYSEFRDSYGYTIRVQESSAAYGHCCWIFSFDKKGNTAHMHLGEPQAYSPHLTKAQAKRVIKALTRFVEEE